LFRVKVRRRLNRHGVQLLLQQPPVTGQAREAFGCRHIELVARRIDAVLKVIGQGDDVVVPVPGKELRDPRSPPAAADHPDIDLGVGLGASNQLRLQERKPHRGGTRAGQEFPTRYVRASERGRQGSW
jgi:hypothetical protein